MKTTSGRHHSTSNGATRSATIDRYLLSKELNIQTCSEEVPAGSSTPITAVEIAVTNCPELSSMRAVFLRAEKYRSAGTHLFASNTMGTRTCPQPRAPPAAAHTHGGRPGALTAATSLRRDRSPSGILDYTIASHLLKVPLQKYILRFIYIFSVSKIQNHNYFTIQ